MATKKGTSKKTGESTARLGAKEGKKNAPAQSQKAPEAGPPKSTSDGASSPPETGGRPGFPIVGVGASAGGLEAFTQLVRHLPPDIGLAFVLIQHLDPKHESMLAELIGRATPMPVAQVVSGVTVKPNHIYVMPPNTTLTIARGMLHLKPRTENRGHHMPVDVFLRALAEDQKSRAIAVILSGTDSDGTLGVEAVKAEGGITFAQDVTTAKYDGMPRSALTTGCVDFHLPPEDIARELVRIGNHPYVVQAVAEPEEMAKEGKVPSEGSLNKIFALLSVHTGVDFTHYKQTTIKRRIVRRMALHKIETFENYVKYIQKNPTEVESLYQDLLIKVTSFFRDPDVFESLKPIVFPQITQNRAPDAPIRIWVPGCATGEEVYSLAICLLEFLGDKASATPIQIFATDISEGAIEKARTGIYVENIASDVSPERLRRFFTKVDHTYRVQKPIRDMCVFAKQNVAKDPPFSRLDLISCRNLLIYLGPLLQRKVMPIFHYALKPGGFLMLGNAETIGAFSDLFALVAKRHKIYARKATAVRPNLEFGMVSAGHSEEKKPEANKPPSEEAWSGFDVQKEADRIVLNRYAPAGVVIDDNLDILHFRGRTSPYLEPAPGRASLNLLRMAREGLLLELRTAVHKARKTGALVRKEGVQVRYNSQFRQTNLEVIPIKAVPPARDRCFLVLFEEATPSAAERTPETDHKKAPRRKADRQTQAAEDRYGRQLKQELAATRDYLQSIIEEQEATNEELKSANEEILSSNEELQSTNEELETAKEELQSTNEELTTVNEELQNRNNELSQANNDLSNLLSSVNIPIVMLGSDLRIRRFTPMAEKLLNLIPTDIGRPISDIKYNITVPDLSALVLEVIDTISIRELEVQDKNGHWYTMWIRPYRTSDNKIDGAVIMLMDIDVIKRSAKQARESHEKDLLLREIHHRVKNNLQIITSLLNLQSGQIQDPQAADMIRESRNRVRAMAMIHELLYQSKDMPWVNVGAYVQNLVSNLFKSYGVDGSRIRLALHLDNIRLSIDTALPVGLIINELVSNSLKHAFKDEKKGEIRVEMRPLHDDAYTLTVADTASCFPKDLDPRKTKTLGLHLVNTLVSQLQGKLDVHTDGKTEFRITLKEIKRPDEGGGAT